MADHRKRENDLLDDRARQVAQKVAAEAESFIAQMLLRDFLKANELEQAQERETALHRVALEVKNFLDSLSRQGVALESGTNTSEGPAVGCGEAATVGPSAEVDS